MNIMNAYNAASFEGEEIYEVEGEIGTGRVNYVYRMVDTKPNQDIFKAIDTVYRPSQKFVERIMEIKNLNAEQLANYWRVDSGFLMNAIRDKTVDHPANPFPKVYLRQGFISDRRKYEVAGRPASGGVEHFDVFFPIQKDAGSTSSTPASSAPSTPARRRVV